MTRTIARHHIDQASLTRTTGATGAVTLVMSRVITLPMAAEELAARRSDLAKIARLVIVPVVAVCFLPTRRIYAIIWLPGDD